jgi:hypothetical protein
MIKLKKLLTEDKKKKNNTKTFSLSSTDPYEYKLENGKWYTKFKSKKTWLNMKAHLDSDDYKEASGLLNKYTDENPSVFIAGSKQDKSKTEKDKDKETTKKSDISGNIVIGDSQTPYVAKQSTKVKMVSALQQGGKGVNWLRDRILEYPLSANIKNVVLCIGTNGGYGGSGDEKGLFSALRKTFPNAKIYAVQGSWGWGGVSKYSEQQVRNYYQSEYEGRGATLINPPIGNIEPHGHKPVYKKIGAAIDNLL